MPAGITQLEMLYFKLGLADFLKKGSRQSFLKSKDFLYTKRNEGSRAVCKIHHSEKMLLSTSIKKLHKY